jgi:hypothetical protein
VCLYSISEEDFSIADDFDDALVGDKKALVYVLVGVLERMRR